jgi:hypothetical protein
MALEEVHNLISQLWNEEISWLQLEKIFFLNYLSNNVKILEPEFMESFVWVVLKHIKILLITAE